MDQIYGRRRNMGLGPCCGVTLAEARIRAADARRLLASDRDPLATRDEERVAQREAQRLKEARRITFETLAKEYRACLRNSWTGRRGDQRGIDDGAFLEQQTPAAKCWLIVSNSACVS